MAVPTGLCEVEIKTVDLVKSIKKTTAFILLAIITVASELSAQQAQHQASKTEKIRIGYPSRGITVLPLRIAQVRGFFRDERLEPELIQMRAGILLTALTTRELDYGAPLDGIVRASARGQPLKGILSFVNRPMQYLASRPELTGVKELKGKTLAISSFGSTEHYITMEIPRAHGLEPDRKDVQLVALGDSLVRLEALKRGIVDATVVLIPYIIIARNLGFRVLAYAGEYLELSTPGLGTSDKLLQEKPEQAKRVAKAGVRGLQFLRQNREESLQIMMEWLALDRKTAEEAYDMGLKSFSEDGSPSEKGLLTSIRLAGVQKEIPLAKVFDPRILQQVHKDLKT